MEISDIDLQRLSSLIENTVGIKTPPAKKALLEGRLYKRLKALGMNNFSAYSSFLFSPEGIQKELVNFINVITTNKTEFFREPDHFDTLRETIIPQLVRTEKRKHLQFWSAGCATGEECYTIAMVLQELIDHYNYSFSYTITASDVSSAALQKAYRGIYDEESIVPIPMHLRRKYLLRSREEAKRLIRIDSRLRKNIQFVQLNFMDARYSVPSADVIFCRNVLIYFHTSVQNSILQKLADKLKTGGYLFLGHSETVKGLVSELHRMKATIYCKSGEKSS